MPWSGRASSMRKCPVTRSKSTRHLPTCSSITNIWGLYLLQTSKKETITSVQHASQSPVEKCSLVWEQILLFRLKNSRKKLTVRIPLRNITTITDILRSPQRNACAAHSSTWLPKPSSKGKTRLFGRKIWTSTACYLVSVKKSCIVWTDSWKRSVWLLTRRIRSSQVWHRTTNCKPNSSSGSRTCQCLAQTNLRSEPRESCKKEKTRKLKLKMKLITQNPNLLPH